MRRTKILSFLLILTMLFSLTACNTINVSEKKSGGIEQTLVIEQEQSETNVIPKKISVDSKFEVHYIDVGQADATLILSDDETMLIDGGNPGDSSLIAAYLKKHNISHLNYIICSHAHDDHVGGLPGALSVVSVGKVYAPQTENDIKSYRSFKLKTAAQGLAINNPTPGESFEFGSSMVVFLGPIHEKVEDINDTSIILKITYGNTSFLFTGDASREEEQLVLSQNYNLQSTVLKVGHHGSAESTTYPFLREIMPQYAIISVGDNSYGHPTDEVLSRLRDANVKLYRTDMQGDIVVSSDGNSVTVTTSRNQDIETNTTSADTAAPNYETYEDTAQTYIGNKNTKKFHLPTCHSLPMEKNRIYFNSRDEATESNFSPCKNCDP